MSGIWDYWNNLIHMASKRSSWRPNISQLNAASMAGNILLVFLALVIGLTIGVVGFLLELGFNWWDKVIEIFIISFPKLFYNKCHSRKH